MGSSISKILSCFQTRKTQASISQAQLRRDQSKAVWMKKMTNEINLSIPTKVSSKIQVDDFRLKTIRN